MPLTIFSDASALRIALGKLVPTLALTVLAASALVSQTEKVIDFELLVLSDDKPVAGATVWVEGWEERSSEKNQRRIVGPLKANESGRVRFALPSVGSDQIDLPSFRVLSQHGKDRLGLGTWFLRRHGDFRGVNRLILYLQKAKSVEGQVFFEGKPLAGVRCQLESIANATWNDTKNRALIDFRYASFSMPLRDSAISTKTDAEGRFSLGGVPEDGAALVEFRAEGLGKGTLYQLAKSPFKAELLPGGYVDLAIEGQTEPVTIKNIEMRLTTVKGDFRIGIDGRQYVDMTPGTPMDRGALTVPGIGGYVESSRWLSVPLDPALGYHFGFEQKVDIYQGKTTKVVLKKIPVGTCSGRIVDAKTGKGIPHLSFVLKGGEKWRGEQHTRDFYEKYTGKTDADGNYSISCKGQRVYMLDFGEARDNHTDYELPVWDEVVQRWIPYIPHAAVADAERVRLRDVSLARSRIVKGIVRDESGKLVDGPYEVRCPTRLGRHQKPAHVENGQFTLSQLKPDMPLKFFVRKGKAVNLATVVPLDKLDDPLDLTISEKHSASCSGRIVNIKGEPIPDANVTLVWQAELQRGSIFPNTARKVTPQELEYLRTDDYGRFAAEGLWPSESYYLLVEAKGYYLGGAYNQGNVIGLSATAGGIIDFGDLVLTERETGK